MRIIFRLCSPTLIWCKFRPSRLVTCTTPSNKTKIRNVGVKFLIAHYNIFIIVLGQQLIFCRDHAKHFLKRFHEKYQAEVRK